MIDWVFHLSLIVVAAIVGFYLYRVLGREGQRQLMESARPARLADAQAKGAQR